MKCDLKIIKNMFIKKTIFSIAFIWILFISSIVYRERIYSGISEFDAKYKIIEDIINIAYCTTSHHLSNTGYSIISILNRTKSKIHVYLYTPELFDKKNTIFDKLEILKKGQIKFFMDTLNYTLCKINFHNQWNFWNPFAYARIYMIEKIPVSKVIYLDTDVYGCDDINSLWKVKLGNNLIAGVLDKVPWKTAGAGPAHLKILNSIMSRSEFKLMNNSGLTVGNYVNSGVLYMNIDELRKVNFTNRCVESYRRNQTFYPDQDLINIFAGHRRIILDWKYNKNIYGNWAKCVLRHYNQKKVNHPVVVRHHEDYDYYFDARDEYDRLMSMPNRTV